MAEQSIGKVVIVYGTVKAQSPDGIERVLGPNSPILLNDRISTGPDGAISIVFSDPENTQLDLGRMTDMVIDNSVIGSAEVDLEEVTAEVDAIQQALESGEEIDIADTAAGPAAGSAGAGGGGRPIYRDELDGKQGDVNSGAETEGVGYGFTETLLDVDVEPVEPVVFAPPPPETRSEPVLLAEEPEATPLVATTPPPTETTPPPTTPPPEEPELSLNRAVEEEALSFEESDFSDGNPDDNDTVEDEIEPDSKVVTGDLGEGTWSIVSTDGLPDLTSQSDSVQYRVVGTTLEAYVEREGDDGDQLVFIFDVQPDGTYEFRIIDQLDHPIGGGENSIEIDLSQTLQVVIDSTPFTFPQGSVVFTAVDDIPVAAVDAQGISVTLDESGLSMGATDLSLGNPDNPADAARTSDNDSGSGATSVATLFSIGADEDDGDDSVEVSYGFVDDVSGLDALNLTSKGDAVTWNSDGQTLTATADSGGADERVILTVNIAEATGDWTADLDDQFDHVVPVSGAVENTDLQGTGSPGSIDLTNYLSVTDYDGDTYVLEGSNLFTVSISDDIPVASLNDNLEANVAATVYEDGLRLAEPDLSEGNDQNTLGTAADEADESDGGNLLSLFTSSFTVGADEEGTASSLTVGLQSATGPVLFSKGEQLEYSVVDNTLTASTSNGTVFTLTVASDGTWDFDLDDQLDHVAGGGENTALRTSESDQVGVPGIDLSAFLLGTLTGADQDGDSVNLTSGVGDGSFVINVVDDVPIPEIGGSLDASVAATVYEDGLRLAEPDLSEGNDQNTLGDTADEADQSDGGNLLDLFTSGVMVGADEEGTFPSATVSLQSATGPTLYSKGEQLQYSVVGDTLTASTSNGTVFTLTVASDGTWEFDLDDQLDHVAGDGENTLLRTSPTDDTGTAGIDLSAFLQGTLTGVDEDGDPVNLTSGVGDGSFVITVVDDIPVAAVDAQGISVTLDESGLSLGATDLSLGNPDNPADAARTSDNDSGSGATSVATLFSIGADEDDGDDSVEVSYGFVDDVSSLDALNLTSKGVAVTWNSDGQTLTATAGDRTVMTIDIDGVTGNWSADLDDQFDHVVPASGAVENTDLQGTGSPGSIDLTNYLTATDYDGDIYTLDGSDLLTVTIVDDIPVAAADAEGISATLDESGLGSGNPDNPADAARTSDNASGSGATSVAALFSIGADEDDGDDNVQVSYGFVDDVSGLDALNFTSQGDAVTWSTSSDGQTLTATAGGRTVMTVDINEATGDWIADLDDQFDHVVPLSGAVENTGLQGTGSPGSIDLTNYLSATDYDGDTYILEGSDLFTVTIIDDIPVARAGAEGISATLDESGLGSGNPDNPADAARTSDNASGSGATSVAALFSIGADEDDGDDSAQVSYGFVDDVSGLDALNFTSQGDAVTWSTSSDGQTLTAAAGGRTVMTVDIDASTGNWTADLDDQFDHELPVSGAVENTNLQGTGAPDSVDLTNYLSATDYDGDTYVLEGSNLFTVTVVDDIPEIGVPQDALLANETGNVVTGSLDVSEGADEPSSISLPLSGPVVSLLNDGTEKTMTYNGQDLFWVSNNAEGTSWSAVSDQNPDGDPDIVASFNVSVNPTDGTYTVDIVNGLDGQTTTSTFDFSNAINGGNDFEPVFADQNAENFVWATGTSESNLINNSEIKVSDARADVNYAATGIGSVINSQVNGFGVNNSGGENSDRLFLTFLEDVTVDIQEEVDTFEVLPITSVSIAFDKLNNNDTAYLSLLTTNDDETDTDFGDRELLDLSAVDFEFEYDPATDNIADVYTVEIDGQTYIAVEGSASGAADSNLTITSDTAFDTILFEGDTGNYEQGEGYRVLSAEITQTEVGDDQTLIVPFEVTDADGDTDSGTFSVTFDADGDLNANQADGVDGDTSFNGMVISGRDGESAVEGSGDDVITGTEYNDTIYGGDGADIIDGGGGNDFIVGEIGDDIIDGGAGDDVIIGGQGADDLDGGADDDILVGDVVDFGAPGVDDTVIIEDNAADTIDGNSDLIDGADADDVAVDLSPGTSEDSVTDADFIEAGDPEDPLLILVPPPEDAS